MTLVNSGGSCVCEQSLNLNRQRYCVVDALSEGSR
jgi:hypothetical protein